MFKKNVPEIDGLRIDFAHKGGGGGGGGQSAAAAELEKAQTEELAQLKVKEEARVAALQRGRRGRSLLISGGEEGLNKKLGQ